MSEVKNLPDGWMETTLGEVADIGSSKRIFFSDYVLEGIPFYRSKEIIEKQKGNNISLDLFITEEKFNEIDSQFGSPKENDILLTSVGTIGIPYIVKENEKFYFKDGNLTWFKNYKKIYPLFLYHWLLSSIGMESLKKITIGSTQSALTIAGLRTIPIIVPNITEQKSIAEILTVFDNKIELLQSQNKTLEEMAQTLFAEWFGKYDVDDDLPEGWRVGKLGDVTKTFGGTTPSTKNPNFWNGNIAWTSPKDLSNSKGMFLLKTEKKITQEGLKKISSGLLPKRTLLLSSRAPIGYLALTNIELAINQGYIAILPEQYFSNNFMYLWLKENMKLVESASNGSTFMEISKSSFRNIDCIIPDKNILEKSDNIINPIFEKVLTNLIQIQTLTKTRDELLPRIMSGEVRVEEFKIL